MCHTIGQEGPWCRTKVIRLKEQLLQLTVGRVSVWKSGERVGKVGKEETEDQPPHVRWSRGVACDDYVDREL